MTALETTIAFTTRANSPRLPSGWSVTCQRPLRSYIAHPLPAPACGNDGHKVVDPGSW